MTRSGRARLAWLILLIWIPPVAEPQAEQQRVLMLLETSGGHAADLFARSLADSLRALPEDVDLYTEIVDVNRFGGSGQDAILADFLDRKYAEVPMDLLVAAGPGALAFAIQYRDALFANVPVVFAAVSEANPVLENLPGNVTGITSHFDLTGTLELALSLQPQAIGVAVVSGAAPRDRMWNARAQSRLSAYEGRLDVQYLAGLPLDALLSQLGQLPRDTIVILTTLLEDGAGRRFIPTLEVAGPISAASSAPVYGVYETYIGRGVVGGHVDGFRTLGAETAALVRQILGGESATDLPVRRSPSDYVVDWRQMQRWGLDEALLPPGTRVRFREPALWSEYKWAIVATLLVVLLQGATIAALLFQRARRREAEARRRESELRFLAQLAHINRVAAMGEFAGSMAHELTQPLSAILNNADYAAMQLEKGSPDSAQLREVIEDIRADDRRAVDIIRSMRRFMKRHEVVMRPIELKPLVEEVLSFAAVQAQDRNVRLRFEPEPGLPTVAGDRVHLQQVLMNLVLNAMDAIDAAAIDAAEAGPREVLVTARWQGSEPVTVSVSDTGKGIPEGQLEAIFNPFYTTKKDGIGMGLAIIRTIIEAHRGRVWAENNPSGGAVFHFTLPAGTGEHKDAHDRPAMAGAPASLVVCFALAWTAPDQLWASGADARPQAIDEIVVTARRREERAQDVPLALSVHGGEELDATGTWSLDRLQRLDPSVHVFGFNPRTTSISIRALGGNVGLASDGLESGVGVFVDDVYLGRVGPALFELVDLERVEVLRGPQEILFGRNTTAGVISLVTRPPSLEEPEAAVEASFGDYGFRQVKASVSGPLRHDRIAGRLSISSTRRDGFIDNVRTGESLQDFDNRTIRGQLLFVPAPDLEIRVIGDYAEQALACCTAVGVGAFDEFDDGTTFPNSFRDRTERLSYEPLPFLPFNRKVDVDSPIRADMDQWGVSLHVDWSLDGADVTSVTAYREWDWDPENDLDYTGLPVLVEAQTANRQDQFSQEFRIASRGDRRIDYAAGLYHYEETVDGFGSFAFGSAAPQWFFPPESPLARPVIEAAVVGFAAASTSSAGIRSDAVFAQGTWHVNESLDLSAGVRFTSEHRSGQFEQRHVAGASLSGLTLEDAAAAQAIRDNAGPESAYTSRVEDDAVSGSVTVSYATRYGTSYVTASLGHKAGGLNVGNLPSGIDPAVRPETVRHYELGTKNRLFADTTTVNVAVFRTDVSDYQTSVIEGNASGGRLFEYISNIEEVVSQGFEVEAAWSASERFTLSAGIAYADAEYVSYPGGPCPVEVALPPAQCDLSGQPLAGAPKVSWTLVLAGREPLGGGIDFYWRLDHSDQSSVFTNVSNSRYSRVAGYGLSNLAAGLRWGERWDLALWTRNVFDEAYFQLTNGLSTGLVVGVPGEQRTVGMTLRRVF